MAKVKLMATCLAELAIGVFLAFHGYRSGSPLWFGLGAVLAVIAPVALVIIWRIPSRRWRR